VGSYQPEADVGSSPAPATNKRIKSIERLAFFDCKKTMFTVYVLYSRKNDKLYIGYTSDIEQRFLSHNELATKGFTTKYRPWEIIYTESYTSKTDALKREKQLKQGQGREWIRKTILKT